MNSVIVLAAVLVSMGAWFALFRGDRRDIWPRTWVIAGVLVAFSLGALAVADRLGDVVGPVDLPTAAIGLAVGATWLVATHVGHAVLCRLFPSFIDQVKDLYALGIGDPWTRVLGPIVAMAVAEELLFRGVIGGLGGFAAGVVVYTAVQVFERKWALTLAALLGGLIWGGLFELTGGLVAPVIAHVLWTAALTLLWPLRGCGPEPLETPADTPRTTSPR